MDREEQESISGDRVRLKLVGITYNQIENGVYAVILQEAEGPRRVPIIIGYPEAQAIECRLMGIDPPRPLTHDLMAGVMKSYDIELREVTIKRLPTGVFTADLLLMGHDGVRMVDSRSSDAIALAIRMDAPIYTSREVMDMAGIEPQKQGEAPVKGRGAASKKEEGRKSREQILKEMQQAAEREDYEEAARLKTMLDNLENRI